MHRSAEAGQRDTSGALANPPAPACRPSATAIGDRARAAWVHYLVPPLGSVCVLHPQGSLVCRRENQNWNGKVERRKGERWLVQRGQLLTAVFYFILFYFILFYFILFYFILFYFILFYFILFSNYWFSRDTVQLYFILFYFILFSYC
jgi:hypothetical protein